jgi:hypothetical protein
MNGLSHFRLETDYGKFSSSFFLLYLKELNVPLSLF